MGNKLCGGIEAGGTKFICAVGSSPDKITARVQIPTTTPSETLEQVISFFKRQDDLAAIGIGSFGPLDLDKQSATHGYITTTPKNGWEHTDLVSPIAHELNIPVALDTDVDCAALAEQRYGAAAGLRNVAYMTVGTGIGIGCISNGRIFRGLTHTEMGHMIIPRAPQDKDESACPYHDSCLEGLASGTALKKRHGEPAESLDDPDAWALEARYLAYGIVNTVFCTMPERIVIGGGVMGHSCLLEDVRAKVQKLVNGYLAIPALTDGIEEYIVAPKLGSLSGVTGAMILPELG